MSALLPPLLNRSAWYKAFGVLTLIFWSVVFIVVFAKGLEMLAVNGSHHNPYLSPEWAMTIGFVFSIFSITQSAVYYSIRKF
jgi:hypothetical protein